MYGFTVMCGRFYDIACVTENPTLTELSLDGNPLASNPDYRRIIYRMKNLELLDTRLVTVQYYNLSILYH